jgi:hypothetical protein
MSRHRGRESNDDAEDLVWAAAMRFRAKLDSRRKAKALSDKEIEIRMKHLREPQGPKK